MWDWNFFYFPTIMNWNIVNCAGWTESLLGVKYHIRVSWIQYKSNIILQHLEKYFRVQSSQPLTVVGKFQGDVVRAVSSFERTSVPDPVLIRSSVVAVHFSQNILYWVGNFHGEVSPPLQHPEIVDGHDLLFSFRLSTFITRERIQQKLYKYLDLQCKIFFIFDPLTGVYAKKPHCKKKIPDGFQWKWADTWFLYEGEFCEPQHHVAPGLVQRKCSRENVNLQQAMNETLIS